MRKFYLKVFLRYQTQTKSGSFKGDATVHRVAGVQVGQNAMGEPMATLHMQIGNRTGLCSSIVLASKGGNHQELEANTTRS